MKTRQAAKWMRTLLTLLILITACLPSNPSALTSTPGSPASALQPTLTPAPTTDTIANPSQPACLTLPGRVDSGTVASTKPPQAYFIYLPPCYDDQADTRYPVLYLLHGQTYTADQWIRLGAVDRLDKLVLSGKTQPFIIVFPDDRYWNLEAGPGFGDRLISALIPHIDKTYHTIPNRSQRAIGGMSRGAGWALRLGLSNWKLFGIMGLHSLAVFQGDGSRIERWLKDIPVSSYPIIFMDIGDNDPELAKAQQVESLLNDYGLPHEWHLYSGVHTEEYWHAHVQEYIEWYASQWNNP